MAIILLKPATNETRTLIKSEGYNSFSMGCFIPLSYMGDLEGQFEITNSMSMINPKILENSCMKICPHTLVTHIKYTGASMQRYAVIFLGQRWVLQ